MLCSEDPSWIPGNMLGLHVLMPRTEDVVHSEVNDLGDSHEGFSTCLVWRGPRNNLWLLVSHPKADRSLGLGGRSSKWILLILLRRGRGHSSRWIDLTIPILRSQPAVGSRLPSPNHREEFGNGLKTLAGRAIPFLAAEQPGQLVGMNLTLRLLPLSWFEFPKRLGRWPLGLLEPMPGKVC